MNLAQMRQIEPELPGDNKLGELVPRQPVSPLPVKRPLPAPAHPPGIVTLPDGKLATDFPENEKARWPQLRSLKDVYEMYDLDKYAAMFQREYLNGEPPLQMVRGTVTGRMSSYTPPELHNLPKRETYKVHHCGHLKQTKQTAERITACVDGFWILVRILYPTVVEEVCGDGLLPGWAVEDYPSELRHALEAHKMQVIPVKFRGLFRVIPKRV